MQLWTRMILLKGSQDLLNPATNSRTFVYCQHFQYQRDLKFMLSFQIFGVHLIQSLHYIGYLRQHFGPLCVPGSVTNRLSIPDSKRLLNKRCQLFANFGALCFKATGDICMHSHPPFRNNRYPSVQISRRGTFEVWKGCMKEGAVWVAITLTEISHEWWADDLHSKVSSTEPGQTMRISKRKYHVHLKVPIWACSPMLSRELSS